MPCIHFKFSSELKYDTVTFSGLHISLRDLKHMIMGRENLKAANDDLQITNAETKEEYTDDNVLIPKNSLVIVRRVPVGGVKAPSKTCVTSQTEPVTGPSKASDDSSAYIPLAQLIKTANLFEANASEEDKIKAMMIQSCQAYDPINYMKKPPPSYTWFPSRKLGHYAKKCPTNGNKNFESVPRIKRNTGIPRSFSMEVKDPKSKGAMLTNRGQYAIPTINAEAYARGKKEKPSFLPEESSSSSSSSSDPVPEELLCPLCKDLMTDAAVIPCCGNSYCDKCIRTTLLQSEEQTCPMCHQTDISPDALVANKFLRQAVNNFRNGTGYTKRLCKQIQQQPPPPPPLLAVPPPAAPVTAAELAKSSSLSISSLLEEKGYQVPVLRQPASLSLLGPQEQSISRTGHPTTASTKCSAGGRPGGERSKSPYSASCYSRSSHTYSTSRSGSSHTRSYTHSFHRSHAHSYSQSPPYTGRDKGKKCNCCARSRSHGSYRSRSRSPLYRRYQVWSRSPVLRGQSPRKQTTPQGKGEREYFHRYRKVPPCDMKTFYGRSLDLRDPFEKERNREWERNCRQWCDKFHKGFAVGAQPPGNRESRDDATSVRDEPTESNVIAFKALSEKEKNQKDKPKAKIGEKKRQVEAVDPPRTEELRKPTKVSQEKVDTDHERSPQMEPPAKKVKEEWPYGNIMKQE